MSTVPVAQIPSLNQFEQLMVAFEKEYGTRPQFIAKTPGRVNLIGEHIDYCGYPVLPMAIKQDIKIAVYSSQSDLLELKNVNDSYGAYKCPINAFEINIEVGEAPKWYKYFLCGVKGVLDELAAGETRGPLRGMMVLISGNIPPASGLSSSSALVSGAVLATAYANGLTLDKQRLANVAARCERYIGTEGGGMDQAIAFLAEQGKAQFIEWCPLTATPVQLPMEAVFVIANSLTVANKAATSDFNERVIECRLGCRLLAKRTLKTDTWREFVKFADLQKLLDRNLDEMEELVKEILPQEVYSRQDLIREFNLTNDEELQGLLTVNTQHMDQFFLRQRALHVFQEANRVNKFRQAANEGDLKAMSSLMRQSHASLCHLYECSHANLDTLVRIADQVGDVGARLTGAGWGGCIVALCDSIQKCQTFMEELKDQYYNSTHKGRDLQNVIFITDPQNGATIYTVQ